MGDRDVVKLAIGRNDDAVRSINVNWHVARIDLPVDASAVRAEANQRDLVG
jgi:hypothetical protein